MQKQPMLRNHVVFLVVSSVLFATALLLYATSGNTYAPETANTVSSLPPITNAYLLQDQMPSSVYRYTLARIDDYLQVNTLYATTMHIDGGVAHGAATYDFTLDFMPQNQTMRVNANVTNTNGFISTSVSINDQLQVPYIPGTTGAGSNTTSYSGFDALVDKGLAAIQANELGQALIQYAPAAGSFAIDKSSISTFLPPANQDTSNATYTFSISVGDQKYDAKLIAIGLYKAQLILTDPQTHVQVYDSGTLDQGS